MRTSAGQSAVQGEWNVWCRHDANRWCCTSAGQAQAPMQSACPREHKPGSPELGQVCVAATGLHDGLQPSSLSLDQGSGACRRQHVLQLKKKFM